MLGRCKHAAPTWDGSSQVQGTLRATIAHLLRMPGTKLWAESSILGPVCQPIIKLEVALFPELLTWIAFSTDGFVYLEQKL